MWIGTMAVTFVLGTGMVALMYHFRKDGSLLSQRV